MILMGSSWFFYNVWLYEVPVESGGKGEFYKTRLIEKMSFTQDKLKIKKKPEPVYSTLL